MRVWALLLLAGCGAPSGEPCERPFWLDGDGDGHGGRDEVWLGCGDPPPRYVEGPADCDDADPDVFPGAFERCDSVDQDCDGERDEAPIDPVWVTADGDGDGFGPPDGEGWWACVGPGRALLATDCDDTRGDVFPGAPETCDPVDRDCDGHPVLGAVDGVPWYKDLDGDGFGRTGNPSTGCDAPTPGWALDATDCDDGRADTFPGAPEAVFDGWDADCDGFDLCPWDSDGDGFAGAGVDVADLGCTIGGATGTLGDCDDADPAISPVATEVPYDGVDQDCSAVTRDDDLDEDGFLRADECDDLDPATPALDAPPFFVERIGALGTDPQWDPVAEPPRCSGDVEWRAGGAAVADYDQDGRLDVFIPRLYAPDQLFHQLGDGSFEEVGAAAGVDWPGSSAGALWVDVDGDADLDLVVTMVGAETNRLYIQDAGSFSEEAALRGVDLPLADPAACSGTLAASAGDVDGDGDLDLLLAAWQDDRLLGTDRSRLLLNDGAGVFSDSGLDLSDRALVGAAFLDTDADGDLDLALTGDHGTSALLRNDAGGFTDLTALSGVGTDDEAAGSAWGDVDGDRAFDWFVSASTENRLFRAVGDGSFVDFTDAAGLRGGASGQGAALADLDHDGDLDLIQQRGAVGALADLPRWYANDGAAGFVDEACPRLAPHEGQGRAVVPFDADNDGDLDLLLTYAAAPPRLLENQGGAEAGGWLQVALAQPGMDNPFGVGAVVEVTHPGSGRRWVARVHADGVGGASGPPEAHFGVPGGGVVDVVVTWPDGVVQVVSGSGTARRLVVSRSP